MRSWRWPAAVFVVLMHVAACVPPDGDRRYSDSEVSFSYPRRWVLTNDFTKGSDPEATTAPVPRYTLSSANGSTLAIVVFARGGSRPTLDLAGVLSSSRVKGLLKEGYGTQVSVESTGEWKLERDDVTATGLRQVAVFHYQDASRRYAERVLLLNIGCRWAFAVNLLPVEGESIDGMQVEAVIRSLRCMPER